MGTTDRDGVLLHLDKMLKSCKEKGTVTVSLKRYITPENQNWKPGNTQINKVIENEKKAILSEPQKKFSLIVHTKTEHDKASAEIESSKVHSFGNSLLNVFRLNCLKNAAKIQKKIKKPTPKDPNSKRSKKLKERIQLKKMRKIKRKEKKLQKKLTIREGVKKMDIETK